MLPHSDYYSLVWDCMSGYLSDKLITNITKSRYQSNY